eukprot:TRINITY_DN56582_c0_g1_i1.p1 TRINITY_DN56582_c0_g1~~TRINITY_DN56582_c0_g1_i1.p1  ORF type:complete len:732 (+),score=106.26 TRINITY_DN56582_c0_g1_i1:161-2197(+)
MTDENIVNLRRKGLTQIGVLVERSANGPLLAHPLAFAVILAAIYAKFVLPAVMLFGANRWQGAVDAGSIVPRAGGYSADVQWATPFMISLVYMLSAWSGVRFMARRPPVQFLVFEVITVYNCMQVVLNLYQVIAIVVEVRRLGFRMWGYEPDASPEGYALGQLIWLQYHCRQLELMDTFFMIMRKKFEGISFLHMYLRMLNMWGWFFACRFACGGDTYFPALVNSLSQVLQYTYFTLSVLDIRNVPFVRNARVSEVQLAQFVLCTVHNLYVAYIGHLPRWLAAFHLLVIGNGLVLFTDFHHRKVDRSGEAVGESGKIRDRVIFSFDSAGWLYIYQFGVACWLQDHLMPDITQENANSDDFPEDLGFSGSSGGALTALLLASATPVREVFEHVLAQRDECSKNPRMMPVRVREALRKYQYPEAPKALTQRLRILVTRVLLRPPFFMGEVVDEFPDNETATQWLLASCHVPIALGIMPFRVDGKGYYDGGMWSSLLVPWRGGQGDSVVKVSGIGSPTSDIGPPLLPPWWAILPPSERVLRGLFWRGYGDAARWFRTEPATMLEPRSCKLRRLSSTATADVNRQEADIGSGLKRWQAATRLVRKKILDEGTDLPIVDPVSGVDVCTLVREFETAANVRLKIAGFVAFSLIPLAAITMLPARNAVLAVAISSSLAFTWTLPV